MRFIPVATLIALSFLGTSAIFAQDIILAPGVSVGPGQSASLPVSLANPAPRVIYVSLASSDSSVVSVNPPNIIFLEGATKPTATPQVTGVSFGSASISASAFGFATASQVVQVNATLSFGPSSQTIPLGSSQILFLTLSSPAPTAQTINVSSDNPNIVSVPPTVTIPANSTFAHFNAMSVNGGTTVIHATGGPNVAPAAVNVTVVAPAAIILQPVNLNLGQSAPLSLSLGTPAPAGGVSVALTTSDSSRVSISPPSVFIPAGASSPFSAPQVTGVNIGSSTINASAPGYTTASQVVPVNATLTFAPQNLTLAAGSTQIVMLKLSSAAPPNGFLATLSSDNPGIADLQHTVGFFPDGSSVASNAVLISAIAPGTTVIHASAPPFIPDTTLNVTVVLPGTITLPTNLSFGLTQTVPFPIQLGTPAPPGGVNVTLTSSDSSKVSVAPGIVFIPGGSTTPTTQPQVSGLNLGSVNINASAPGFAPASTTVTITGAAPSTVKATGGTPQSALINTQFPAALSATVTDSSSNPVSGVAVTFRAPVSGPSGVFAGGQTTVTATTNAAGVATSPLFTANGTVGSFTVSAIVSGVPNPAVFQLTNTIVTVGPIMLPGSVTLAPNQSMPYPVTLGIGAPAGGVTITLTSSDTSKITITPSTVFIAGGATAPATQPTINGITFGSVTINASAPGFASASQSAQVAGTMSLSSGLSITGTETKNLTLTLSVAAPAAGFTINVASNSPAVATVPATVAFAPNATTTQIPVTGVSPGTVTITASSGTTSLPSATSSVTVKAKADVLLASGVTVGPGQLAPIAVTLNSPATRTIYVNLVSSDTSKVTVNPAFVIVLEGATSPTIQPQVTGVDFGTATITASSFGLTGDSEIVRVTAALSFGPTTQTIPKGSAVMLFLSLSAITPTDQTIALSSDNPSIATVPAQVTIRANTSFASVMVTGVGAGSTIIHATDGPNITPATFNANVVAPATIILPSNLSLTLGQTAPFPVTLGAPAPAGGLTVALASSDSSLVSISPASISVPAGSTTPTVQPQVTANNIGSVNISASAPGYATATAVVPVGATLTFSPPNLIMAAGTSQIILLKLSTAAPPNGFFATLSSDNPSVADLQHIVGFFPDGSSHATNAIILNAISPGTTVIRASALPFIPETTLQVTVVGGPLPQ